MKQKGFPRIHERSSKVKAGIALQREHIEKKLQRIGEVVRDDQENKEKKPTREKV